MLKRAVTSRAPEVAGLPLVISCYARQWSPRKRVRSERLYAPTMRIWSSMDSFIYKVMTICDRSQQSAWKALNKRFWPDSGILIPTRRFERRWDTGSNAK